ncbi:SMP-30/gluconolactonase/LRE family protein [Streptomyces sp. NPDC056411]|uniref:SMP-30/gluconolactonase/LRE family protein n=1 Tax=Streptomyces sp. NPDC056411 TaxID=3345813 RepID=UPI0035DD5222
MRQRPGGPRPLPAARVVAPEIEGPEDVVAGADGSILTGAADGTIWRLTLPAPDARPAPATVDGDEQAEATAEAVAHTGGRPLGLQPLPDGALLVCDARRGLLRIEPGDGAVRVLADAVDGVPLRFCSNVTATVDGTVYFTVSSRRHGLDAWPADIMEHLATGQLLRLRPGGEPEVLLSGLQFANGVAPAPDGSFLVVAETGARLLRRHWLTGPRAGHTDTLLDRLPGHPDNISVGPDGSFWVALAGPRQAALELLHALPFPVRRAAWRAQRRIRPLPPPHPTVRVLAVRPDGGVACDLRAARSPYRMVTSVCRTKGRLVMGSVAQRGIAVCALPGAKP